MHVIGVDAYPLGWVAVELREGKFLRAILAASLYEVVAGSSGSTVIGVDIPLGLLPDRHRAADTAAAEHLGPRRSSVFQVPPRPVWQQTEFGAANRMCRELTGAGLSRQSWALRPKVLEANVLWERHPGLLFEAHPEVSFRAMAGAPLTQAKKTWAGHARRRALLARHGIAIPDEIGPAGQAPPDDVLDAAAVAWTAHRMATGTAASHPNPPEQSDGRAIAIWY